MLSVQPLDRSLVGWLVRPSAARPACSPDPRQSPHGTHHGDTTADSSDLQISCQSLQILARLLLSLPQEIIRGGRRLLESLPFRGAVRAEQFTFCCLPVASRPQMSHPNGRLVGRSAARTDGLTHRPTDSRRVASHLPTRTTSHIH